MLGLPSSSGIVGDDATGTCPLGRYDSLEFSYMILPLPLSEFDLILVGPSVCDKTPLRKGLRLCPECFTRDLCSFEPDLVGLPSVIGGDGSCVGPVVVVGDVFSDDGLSKGKIMSGLVREGEGVPIDMLEAGITSMMKCYRISE